MEDSQSRGYCRINDFPDALLLHLLTFLPIKAAVQTSILSKRWRYLQTAIPSLKFDVADFSKKPTRWFLPSPLYSTDFFTVVPQFLLRHVSPLNNCTLDVRLGNTSETRVLGDFVRHLLAVKKVKEFSLAAYLSYNPKICYEPLLDPSHCLSLESLKLRGCVFNSRLGVVLRFPILKNLSLCLVVINQSWLRYIFCSCPFLESFSLERCTGSSDNMRISTPRLQNLKIVKTDFITNLVVAAPCLQSFEFDCRSKFDSKSCVRELSVTGTRMEVLKACGCALRSFRKHTDEKDYPRFSSLERIVIRPCSMNRGHLEDVASLLGNGTPRQLLHIYIDQETVCISLSIPNTFPEQLLHHLRSVSIYPFKATQDELHLVKVILQAALSLESMRIAPGAMNESQARIATRELLCLQRKHPQVNIDFSSTEI